MFNNFFPKIVPFIINTVQPGMPHIIWDMRIACWIPNVTNTISEYVAEKQNMRFMLNKLCFEYRAVYGKTLYSLVGHI
jgi:hypothetical protein